MISLILILLVGGSVVMFFVGPAFGIVNWVLLSL